MNAVTKPDAPGAGAPPPELTERDNAIEQAKVALDRIRRGRAARSLIFHGPRGVGKTVLLNRISRDSEARCPPEAEIPRGPPSRRSRRKAALLKEGPEVETGCSPSTPR